MHPNPPTTPTPLGDQRTRSAALQSRTRGADSSKRLPAAVADNGRGMRVLYIEDNPTAREYVERGLTERGFEVDLCSDGPEGLKLGLTGQYDVLVLDLGLPSLDGLEVLQRLRRANVETPTLVLSARSDASDRIKGLNLGADDYLAKPFAFEELVARMKAVRRRMHGGSQPAELKVADLVLDVERHAVTRAGEPISLTRREFALLELLMRNERRVLSRSMITERVWGIEFENYSNVINVHINHLRNKVDHGHPVRLIHTVTGVGYILEERAAT
jgi:two-component system copper resistance phosphate regulon response regulator CusR